MLQRAAMLPGHFCTSLPHTHVNPQVGLCTWFRCAHSCFLGDLSHLWTSEHVLMPTGKRFLWGWGHKDCTGNCPTTPVLLLTHSGWRENVSRLVWGWPASAIYTGLFSVPPRNLTAYALLFQTFYHSCLMNKTPWFTCPALPSSPMDDQQWL